MTPNKEDYLKLIFELGGAEIKVTNKQIVSGLNVSAASVSEMITKLEKEGYVNHSPYQGVQLTEEGLQKASTLVRKHRLWEVFLVEHLGYSWNEVHEEAEVLEHVTSDDLANRLDSFLGHPDVCPHGGVIPEFEKVITEKELITLADSNVGTLVKIERVLDDKELLDYLLHINLNIHDVYSLEEIEPYEGPIALKSKDGTLIQVSQKAANNIFVSTVSFNPEL